MFHHVCCSGLQIQTYLSKYRYLTGNLYRRKTLLKCSRQFASECSNNEFLQLSNQQLTNNITAQEIKIPVPWGHVAGKWWGPRDKQPIIAIHGWQNNAGTWDNLIPLLPENTSVLCLDLPGHGFSSHYPKGTMYYIYWDGLYLLRRIVKYYEWRNVTLMGHSLGTTLSLMYAATFPDDADKIISIEMASSGILEPEYIIKSAQWGIDKYFEYENVTDDKIPSYSYDEMIDIVYDANNGSLSRESCRVLMKRGMMPAPIYMEKNGYLFKRDPRLKVSGMALMPIETILEFTARVKCKVLNFRVVPGQIWERLDYYMQVIDKLKEVTEVQYIEVQGTHYLHLESPEKIVNYIKDFIEVP